MTITKKAINDIIYKVLGAAIDVHKELGPGLLINFNVSNLFNEGQKTFVNELYRNLPNE